MPQKLPFKSYKMGQINDDLENKPNFFYSLKDPTNEVSQIELYWTRHIQNYKIYQEQLQGL